jgi:hypothetical protein
MSNLKSAKDSLAAELAHARQGLAFYHTQVEKLEEALAALESLNGKMPGPRIGAKKQPAVPSKHDGTKAGGKTRKQGKSLPKTGKDFWTNLITNQPISAKEIFDAAVEALDTKVSQDDLKKLSQRQANALHMLVKEKQISDTGSGRDRRFFRPT